MKIAFLLVLGICLGWVNAQWDLRGQMAIAQIQKHHIITSPQTRQSESPGYEVKAIINKRLSILPF